MNLDTAISYSEQAEGWLYADEQVLLYHLARKTPSSQAIVELGSWQGRSTIMLAAGSAAGSSSPVYAVDFFKPSSLSAGFYQSRLPHGSDEYQGHFQDNLHRAGLGAHVHIRRGSTIAQATLWNNGPVGLLFIDADHEYESVQKDFIAWAPNCVTDAVVAFHDYKGNSHPGVARFVDRLIITGLLMRPQIRGSILYGSLVTQRARSIACRLMTCPDILPRSIRKRLVTRKRIRGKIFTRRKTLRPASGNEG